MENHAFHSAPAGERRAETPQSGHPPDRKLIFRRAGAAASAVLSAALGSAAWGADFQLLTWDNARATTGLPSAVDRKPSASAPTAGDWLVFTADDQIGAAGANPNGALSHNLVALAGASEQSSLFHFAPSLSGTLSLQFASGASDAWDVTVSGLSYAGQAAPGMFMNQSLIKSQSPAALAGTYGVDGIGNSGSWSASAAGGWAIRYNLDFAFETSADGDTTPGDVDAAFNDKPQQGYLIPTSELTQSGLSGLALDDPAGFFGGDFRAYLLNEIAPRLPDDATYLLITQMAKTHPDYTEAGLPITTAGLVGNTTIAYTTAPIPEPHAAVLLVGSGALLLRARRGVNRSNRSNESI